MRKYVKRLIYFMLIILIIPVVFVVFVMITFRNFGGHEECPLETLTLRDYVFEFKEDCSSELSRAISCQVMKDREIIFPLTHLGRTAGEIEFELVPGGEQHKLVAVVDKVTPQIVYAIYDFNNHQAGIFYLHDSRKGNIQDLLQRFNKFKKGKLLTWPDSANDEMRMKIRLY